MTTELPLFPAPLASAEAEARNRKRPAPMDHVGECFCCGRKLTAKGIACFVEMTTTRMLVPVGVNVSNSQGCFPVGTTCVKHVPKLYRFTKKYDPSLWDML